MPTAPVAPTADPNQVIASNMFAANAAAAAFLPFYAHHPHFQFPNREPVFAHQMVAPSPAPASKNPALFPMIQDRLQGLDAGPHGVDQHNFAQYAPNFRENGILRIHEIADANTFSCQDLLAICPGIKLGTANLILMYARDDVKAIWQM